MITAMVYTVLLFCVVAEDRLSNKGGRCIAAQQRLVKLRAEIREVEQDAEAACLADVTQNAPHLPVPPLDEALAAGAASVVDHGAASAISGGRRLQTSGMATTVAALAKDCAPTR